MSNSNLNFADFSLSQQGMTISPLSGVPYQGVENKWHPNKPIFPEGIGLNATPKQDRMQKPEKTVTVEKGVSKRDMELAALNNVSKSEFKSHHKYGMTLDRGTSGHDKPDMTLKKSSL